MPGLTTLTEAKARALASMMEADAPTDVIAQRLGVSRRTVQRWRREGLPDYEAHGIEDHAWSIERLKEEVADLRRRVKWLERDKEEVADLLRRVERLEYDTPSLTGQRGS